jgi:hypothetical protein
VHLAACRPYLSKDGERQVRADLLSDLPLPTNLNKDVRQFGGGSRQLGGNLRVPRSPAIPRQPEHGDEIVCEADVVLDFGLGWLFGAAERGIVKFSLPLTPLAPKLFGERFRTRHAPLPGGG